MRLFDKLIAKVEEEQKKSEKTTHYADQIRHLARAQAFLEAAKIAAAHVREV